ncbi:MAG: hypothetical protein QF486_02650 [Candidatus Woesearchaeota archaeon]|nr:hypothetical protein [Candidatus Woesearchaeota archaeon]MDP7198495.1 hypothetical protein [Candidatus Woesearchaeota archaeon]MDP7466763.1 hypothetical protein [Candidatus Woesearchaeota archaeon]MDP7647988.1 hypothetical protein [Candidatus Woesearchaeota archaeon]
MRDPLNKQLMSYFENLRGVLQQQGYDQTDIDQASVKESVPLLLVVSWGLSAAYFFLTLTFILLSLLGGGMIAWMVLIVGAFIIGCVSGFGLVRATTRPWKVATMAGLAPFLSMILLPVMTLMELLLEKVRLALEPFASAGGKAAAGLTSISFLPEALPGRLPVAFLIFMSAIFIPTLFLIKRKKFKSLACLFIGVIVCFVGYQISHTALLFVFESIAGKF